MNNKFVITMRNTVGAILQRTVFDENDSAEIGLFSPSVADFILGRYLNDWASLETFFIYLNTVSSIKNLENLKKNSLLGDDGYSQILKNLGSKKISSRHLEKNPVYTLKLTQMVIQQKGKPSPDIFEAIIGLVTAINTVPIPEKSIKNVCLVLEFVNASKKHPQCQEIITKFIERYLVDYYDHGNLIDLVFLARKLDTEFQESTLPAIKSAVEKYWTEEIDQNIANDNVLEEYLNPRETGEAFNTLFEYLDDKLSGFDFTEDEISRISESADIQGHIDANIEAQMESEEDYELWEGRGDRSSENDNALVDDLFQRE